MLKNSVLFIGLLFTGFGMFSQNNNGLPSFINEQSQIPLLQEDGNGTLGWIYNNTSCGLDYVSGSVKTGKRGTVGGVNQPAPILISGIPVTATVLKAYLWTGGPANGINITASLTNPNSQSGNFNMTMVGSGPDICWSYPGTYHYRADVTSIISGNGTYQVSGLPTNPPTAFNDMNGATLMIIYNDPSQLWQGTLIIKDGCRTAIGVPTPDTISNYNLCMNSLAGKAFCIVSDLQMTGTSVTMNSTLANYTWNWWNFIEVNTNYVQNQTTTNFNINGTGDCYSLVAVGTYFRHSCASCCQPTFTLSSTNTPNTCNSNGTATAVITGGTPPYTYQWNTVPLQTTQTATGLNAGSYNCYVTDANGCANVNVVIVNAGVNVTINGVNPSCSGGGSATANSTGGTAPYTYSWSTVPVQTNATATNLSSGTYTVTVTDNNGCTATSSVTLNAPSPSGTIVVTTANCGPNGTATVTASNGTPPYTYSWNSVPVQTNALATGLNPGSYTVTITDAFGCTTTTGCVIVASPITASATASPSVIGCAGSSQLNVTSNHPNVTYFWSPTSSVSCTTCQNPVATPTITTLYQVTVTSACGSTSVWVNVTVGSVNNAIENICEVTVDTALNKNLIVWERTVSTSVITSYKIYKETTTPNVYTVIGSQPINNYTTFVDLNSNPFQNASRYKISTVDSCGGESPLSTHHKTIHLSVSNGPNNSWNLNWGNYEGFGIGTYDVYRGTNNNNMTLLNQLPNNQFSYTDLTPPLGPIQYAVVAQNPTACNPTLMGDQPESLLPIVNTISNVVPVITYGIEDVFEGGIHVHPAGGTMYSIGLPNGNNGVVLEIYDITGSLLKKVNLNKTENLIDLGTASKGTYFFRFSWDSGVSTRKVLR